MQDAISFDDLSDDEKAKVIWYNAEFVTSVCSETTKFNLFSLSDFFVEIRFDLHTDHVQGISFLDENELDKYLGMVEIPEVLS